MSSRSFMHELIHFFDHVSSPYGYFLDCVGALLNGSYRQIFGIFNVDSSPPLPVPLARLTNDIAEFERLVRTESRRGFAVNDCLDFFVVFAVIWPMIVALERALEGVAQPGILPMDSDSVLGGLTAVEALVADGQSVFPPTIRDLERLSVDDRPWTVSEQLVPRAVSDNQESFPLGAASLLETRAFLLERGLTRKDPLPALAARSAGTYYAPLVAVGTECLAAGFHGKGEIEDTFLVLADLALYSPIGSPYARMRSTNDWTDVHPGHRFVQLLYKIKEIGPFRRSSAMDPFDYQNLYCTTLGWASPRDFLRLGSEIDKPDFRSRRHRATCKLKLSHPRYIINPNLQYLELPGDDALSAWLEKYMPFVIDTGKSKGGMVGSSTSEIYLERLSFAYLQSLGWSILMSGNPNARQHLEPNFPYPSYLRWNGDMSLSDFFDSAIRKKVRFWEV